MSRIKIELPSRFTFHASIPVRITDINYGGHVGNDAMLGIIHEARLQYLSTLGYTEMSFDGVGLIMADVGIEFKSELFYGNIVHASVASIIRGKVNFDIYYKLEKEKDAGSGDRVIVALAKTGMVCFDYERKKIVNIPATAIDKLGI